MKQMERLINNWLAILVVSFAIHITSVPDCSLIFAGAAGPSTNFNPCAASSFPSGNGFKGIDSTNRVTYVECMNFQVVQSFQCDDGFYFDEQSAQCVTGTWVDPSESSVADNVCMFVYDGFVAIDSSSYVECSNYVEIGWYSCTDGLLFDESLQQCTDGSSASTPVPHDITTNNSTDVELSEISTAIDTTEPTCDNVSSGNVPLSSLQGYLVCNNGAVLVTQYCGASKLYNPEFGVCVNYCASSTTNSVILPNLAGKITCDSTSELSTDNIICSTRTYFDENLGYCRNFCENETQQYVMLNQQGGVTCEAGTTIAVEWCSSGTIYSAVRGVCMQTDSPSLSPITGYPTRFPTSNAPTISDKFVTPTSKPTSTIEPSLDLELAVDVPEETNKGTRPGLVNTTDSGASCISSAAFLRWFTLTFISVIGFYINS
jgi:hypothetical protein